MTVLKGSAGDPLVLIVDDEETILEILSVGLRDHGYRTIVAESAEKALERIRGEDVHYSLIDIRLPGIDGIELCHRLKKQAPNIVNILMTGYPSLKTAVEAVRKHAYDYLIKPFRLDQVLSIMERSRKEFELSCENSYMAETIRALKVENEKLHSMINKFLPDDVRAQAESFERKLNLSYRGLSAVRSYEQQKGEQLTNKTSKDVDD